jgi:hypothetical protein
MYAELPQKIMPYDRKEWKYESMSSFEKKI